MAVDAAERILKDAQVPSREAKRSRTLAELTNEVLLFVHATGFVPDDDLRAHVGTLAGGDLLKVHQAIVRADRAGAITQKVGEGGRVGWEETRGSSGPASREYGEYTPPLTFVMRLRTAALGQVSDDGITFTFERDDKGQIIFNAAQFRAMLEKAHMQAALPLVPDKNGQPLEAPSRQSVSRWRVQFVRAELPQSGTTSLPIRIRRPMNDKGVAVGECRHEALPPGTRIVWSVSWPVSHWHPMHATALLSAAQHVGFSPSGNGRYGGLRGLFAIDTAEGTNTTDAGIR